jgi:hypothetical protein
VSEPEQRLQIRSLENGHSEARGMVLPVTEVAYTEVLAHECKV